MRRIEPSSLTSLHYLATAFLVWLLAAYFLTRFVGLFANELSGLTGLGFHLLKLHW
jgi:hypothetical protein